jgi:hypothetical protein
VKLLLTLAAPLAVALLAMPALAQDRATHSTTVTRHVTSIQHDEHLNAPRHGWRWKRVCKTRWTHHRKIRTCRKVRARW